MVFLAPLWLTLLVPWAMLAALLWRRTADERATTATFLWREGSPAPAVQRTQRRRPPAWVMAALAALLLMIIALAAPATAGRATRVSVILDASIVLSAKSGGGAVRDALIERAQRSIDDVGRRVEMNVILAGTTAADVRSLDEGKRLPFTARETRSAVEAAIEAATRTADAVIVLTDQPLGPTPSNVAIAAPATQPNVGIEMAIGTERPRPSLMVRLANDAPASREVVLAIRTGGDETRQPVSVPANGRATTFVDLPARPGEEVEVVIVDANDGFPLDDRALLLRRRGQPQLVIDGNVGEAATRFAAAHAAVRASDDAFARTIRVSATSTQVDAPQLIVDNAIAFDLSGELQLADHLIVRDVDLSGAPITRTASAPPGEWTTVASIGGRPILLAREQPTPAVWIGFELAPQEVRSVVLLSNAVEWLARNDPPEWRGERPDAVGKDWRAVQLVMPDVDASPGRYVGSAGSPAQVNLPAMVGPHGQSRGDVARLLREMARASRQSLQPSLSLLAGGAAFTACVLARRRRSS